MRYLSRFLEAYDGLSSRDQELVRSADGQIRDYHHTHKAPYGLRIKKLHQRQRESVYEARPAIALRIV